MFDDLDFEEREIVRQVMARAVRVLTLRQARCLILLLMGLNLRETGDTLGISLQAVAMNREEFLDKVRSLRIAS